MHNESKVKLIEVKFIFFFLFWISEVSKIDNFFVVS